MTELWKKGLASHLLGGVHMHDVRDAKFMAIEERLANAETAEELAAGLPKATPMDKDNFLKPTGH